MSNEQMTELIEYIYDLAHEGDLCQVAAVEQLREAAAVLAIEWSKKQ